MKLNKKLITVCSIIAAFTSFVHAERKYAQKHDENVVAATVEMPGNLVGSLFGGGYANRERIDDEQDTPRKKARKQKDMSSQNQPANRRQARRQRRRSSSSDE